MSRWWNAAILSGVVGGIIMIVGCGDHRSPAGPTGTVSGTVTFEGTPVTEGLVSFYDALSGSSGEGQLDAAGKYKISRLSVGNYVVTVLPLPLESAMDMNGGEAPAPNPADIPTRYRGSATSQLSKLIGEGENEFLIEMKKSKK
ncbi:MAG TPA: carboxypeptidase-like regulatory domain-containing protein [Planctomicrobium sp.]|nr:carboxypeptidase-like regulatory domain-containing protein [Planctomicrobium sp.]